MADYPQRPKVEFKSNIPETILLQKQPPKFKGTNKEGDPWWGWEVQHNGEDKTLFAYQQLQTELEGFPIGTTVVINWAEEVNPKTGKKFHVYKVNQAVFDQHGRAPQPAPAPIAKNGLPEDEFRKTRKNNYFLALEDAYEVMEAFYAEHPKVEPKFEDIRAIAISMCIQFDRKS